MEDIFKFPSGLKLTHKYDNTVRSVAISIWIKTGSINETIKNNGVSHFIEHMLFKGTTTRSAYDIVDELDSLGVNVNAFTSKTETCYYTVSLDENTDKCMEVMADMFFNSVFDKEEMTKEKNVILEEIAMCEDTPDDVVIEELTAKFWEGKSLAMSILGSKENVTAFCKKDIDDYMAEFYVPSNMCISIAGNITLEDAHKLVNKYLEVEFVKRDYPNVVLSDYGDGYNDSAFIYKYKDIEQANVGIAFPSIKLSEDKMTALQIFNIVFGLGMSSRLFQTIREKLGLVYSIYSYPSEYINVGMFVIYFATNTSSVNQALKAIKIEIDKLATEPISQKEFAKGKQQLKASFVMGCESTSAVMRLLAKSVLSKNKVFDIDDTINIIDSIVLEDIVEVTKGLFDFSKVCVSYVGPTLENNTNLLEVFTND